MFDNMVVQIRVLHFGLNSQLVKFNFLFHPFDVHIRFARPSSEARHGPCATALNNDFWFVSQKENANVNVPKENTSMCPRPYSSPYHDDEGKYDPQTYPNNYRGPNPRRTDMLPEW